MGWSEMFMERLDDAERHLARGIALAHATGQNHLVTYLRIGQGTTFGLLGRLGEAAVAFDDALETAMLTGSDELRTMALAQLCWITIWQGDLVKAKRIGEEAVASAGATPTTPAGLLMAKYAPGVRVQAAIIAMMATNDSAAIAPYPTMRACDSRAISLGVVPLEIKE